MNRNESSRSIERDDESETSSFRFKSVLQGMLVRWHWLLLGGLIGLGWGFYKAWKAVPLYESRATVVVKNYTQDIMGGPNGGGMLLRDPAALETVRAGLMTYELCEKIASDPNIRSLDGLMPPPPKKLFQNETETAPESVEVPPSPVLAGMIQSWYTVKNSEDTRIMSILVKHPSPLVAATIANTVVEQYLEQRKEKQKQTKIEKGELLEVQAKRLKEELSRSKIKLAIYDLPTKAELALVSAEGEFQALQLRYREKHPKYIEAERKVAQAKTKLRESLRRVVANDADADYWKGQTALIADLDQSEDLEDLREKLIERRAQLETEIESQETISGALETQFQAGRVNEAQNEAEVDIYENARPSRSPSSQRKSTLITQNSLLGLVGGGAIALLFFFLDNKFHTVDDLEEKIDLPVLAAVPKMERRFLKSKKNKVRPGLEHWSETLIFAQEDTQNVLAESFRVLRAAITLLGPVEERKITLVTSSLPSEGKTTLVSNLACAIAQEGRKVILLDLDLRKPSAHKMFGLPSDGQKGAVDVLSGNAELSEAIITDTGLENLDLILSGSRAPSPGELLQPGYLNKFLEDLEKKYDHVLIDSAPVLAVADSRLIAQLADNFCFVVRADQTPKGAVQRAVEILTAAGKRPSGTVLNCFSEKRTSMGKNYGYGGYYSGRKGAYGTYGTYGSDA